VRAKFPESSKEFHLRQFGNEHWMRIPIIS
jgi:hypothetical protein